MIVCILKQVCHHHTHTQEHVAFEIKRRIKDFRRPKKSRIGGVLQVFMYSKKPPVPQKRKAAAMDGEDEESFRRHNRFLAAEYKKARPNLVTVRQLMCVTFAMRRADIESSERPVSDLFAEYPFLLGKEEVSIL